MESLKIKYLYHCLIILWGSVSFAQSPTEMAVIGAGSYVPLYGSTEDKSVKVNSFLLDIYPVTNQDFLEFLKQYPEYSRSKIKRLFASESYQIGRASCRE